MRRAAKVDDNQRAIVETLRAIGASVQSIAAVGFGCPDLLVGYRGQNHLLEVKPGDAKDKRQRELNVNEALWHRLWRGSVKTVKSPLDALRAIGAA